MCRCNGGMWGKKLMGRQKKKKKKWGVWGYIKKTLCASHVTLYNLNFLYGWGTEFFYMARAQDFFKSSEICTTHAPRWCPHTKSEGSKLDHYSWRYCVPSAPKKSLIFIYLWKNKVYRGIPPNGKHPLTWALTERKKKREMLFVRTNL